MRRLSGAALLLGLILIVGEVNAAGRFYSGGHPYHNGHHFMPPSSAYEAVRVRPPFQYGVPMYYFPASYLGGSVPGFHPPAVYQFQYAPSWRQGGWFLNAQARMFVYPQ